LQVYALVHGAQAVILQPDQPFTSYQRRIQDEGDAAYYGAAIGHVVDQEEEHSPLALSLLTEEDRARYMIQTVDVAEPPAGEREASRSFTVGEDGTITAELAFEPAPPAPPPPRRKLPKSTIHSRVNEIGRLGACFAIIQSSPDLFGKWFAPDWPNVYCDDPGLLQVLEAAGCTADEIAQVTA
jgi:hypothetical protein